VRERSTLTGVPLQPLFDSIAKQNALAPAGEFQTDAQRMQF
jgi:hypothetical protein